MFNVCDACGTCRPDKLIALVDTSEEMPRATAGRVRSRISRTLGG